MSLSFARLRPFVLGLALLLGLHGVPRVRAVVSEDALPASAEWISAAADASPGTVYLRRTFQLDPGLVKAVMLAAADRQAVVFVRLINWRLSYSRANTTS